MQAQDIVAELAEREAYLLHHDHRADPSELEAMLAAELTEVNAQGQRVGRDAIMRWLQSKPQDARWVFAEVEACRLGEGHVLLRYVARQVAGGGSGRPGRHASVWRWTESDGWQLLFHQATRIDDQGAQG